MAKLKKKYTEGASRMYTTRNRALKKLQVSLQDFRRLCILKGIYPVEPRSRKQANRGSTKLTTFYYSRDIQLLLSEPLMQRFREHKTFLRKLQHALAKDDLTRARAMDRQRPTYTLNHLVLERYPQFGDALADLDDALCMVFLFATMPVGAEQQLSQDVAAECRALAAEFQHYVVHARALRKVFLSIKGIYYQAEIQGTPVTWIVPYQFSQRVPDDVDFKVMATFLQFYRTLLRFVNFRLFTGANLAYPPALDAAMDDGGAGLGADADGSEDPAVAQRMQTLGAKIQALVASAPAAAAEAAPAYEPAEAGDDESAPGVFSGHVVFLSREVPRSSLEFVLRASGARVGWAGAAGSAYAENDRLVTVQISDRPQQGHRFLDREYVQPQWVYDSVNAGRLLPTAAYLVGQPLPAHLSPFVEYADGDYVPAEAAHASAHGFEGEVAHLQPEDRDHASDTEAEAEAVDGASADESESDDEVDARVEKQYQAQLQAERAGVPFSKAAPAPAPAKRARKQRQEAEDQERQQMAISMLSVKKRRAVNRAGAEAAKRQKDIGKLKARKAQLAKK
ncbi:mRNA-binding ribosome synthesis protein nop7 [Coemansia sp. RSA 2711]|nr:mRNA-binding ribosome synthesis protein nop7 [Coemansia sp. RSA 2711]